MSENLEHIDLGQGSPKSSTDKVWGTEIFTKYYFGKMN